MNTDEKRKNTDGWNCLAKRFNCPCSSVDIRVHPGQALRSVNSCNLENHALYRGFSAVTTACLPVRRLGLSHGSRPAQVTRP